MVVSIVVVVVQSTGLTDWSEHSPGGLCAFLAFLFNYLSLIMTKSLGLAFGTFGNSIGSPAAQACTCARACACAPALAPPKEFAS